MATKSRHGKSREPETSARRTKAARKAVEAVRLREAGWTLREIAAKVGYADDSGAYRAIMRCLGKAQQEAADDLRDLHRRRLSALLRVLWTELAEPTDGIPSMICPHCQEALDPKWVRAVLTDLIDTKHEAVDRIIKVLQREARLEGLDIQGSDEKPEVHRFIMEVSESNGNPSS